MKTAADSAGMRQGSGSLGSICLWFHGTSNTNYCETLELCGQLKTDGFGSPPRSSWDSES